MSALRLMQSSDDATELTQHEQDVLLLARYFARELTEDEATAVETRMEDDARFYALAEPMMIMRRTPGTLRPARGAVVWEWLRQSAAMVVVCIGLGGAGVLAYVYGAGYAVARINDPALFDAANSMEARERDAAAKMPEYSKKVRQTALPNDVITSGTDTVIVRLSNGTVVRLYPGSRLKSEGPPWPIKSSVLRIELQSGAADLAVPYKEMPPLSDDFRSPAGDLELPGGSYRAVCSKGCTEMMFVIESGVVRAPQSGLPAGTAFELLSGGDSVRFTRGKMEKLSGLIGQKVRLP